MRTSLDWYSWWFNAGGGVGAFLVECAWKCEKWIGFKYDARGTVRLSPGVRLVVVATCDAFGGGVGFVLNQVRWW